MRYALAVAEHGGFTAAAQGLHLSQQALSQHVRRLERDLGFALFERTVREVRPTAAGRVWLDAVRGALAQLRHGHAAAVDAHRGDGRTTLRVGFVTGAAAELTSVLLDDLGAAHPQVMVDLVEAPLADTTAGVGAGHVDVGIIRAPLTGHDLDVVELLSEARAVVLAAGHPLAARTTLRPEELRGQPLIGLPGRDRVARDFWSLGDVLGDDAPREIKTAETLNEELQLVAQGRYLSVTATSLTRYYSWPGVVFRPLLDCAASRVCVARRRDDHRDLPVDFLRCARDSVQRRPAFASAFSSAKPGQSLAAP